MQVLKPILVLRFGVYVTKLILRRFLSANLKNGHLLIATEVLENPFPETHCRLQRVLHQTARVIGLHKLVYGGDPRLLFLHTLDYLKGFTNAM